MSKFKFSIWLLALVLLFSVSPTLAEDGVDYGYWCTDCGVQHGPGESCPKASAPSYSAPEEPYDWSQPVSAPVTTTTTKTFAQWASEYNAEGEEFYRNGKYQEAWTKFFAAAFNDPDTPLYKENREKANNALKQQAEEKKRQEDLNKRSAAASKKIKNIRPLDTSVVDLRDKKGPLVVNPGAVKGATAKPRSLKIKEPPAPGSLSDKEIWDLIADMQLHGRKASQVATKQRIFEKNPDKYLTNPLRTKEKLAIDTMRAMDNDAEYVAARKRYVKEADEAIFEAQIKLLEMASADLHELRRKSGSQDFTDFDHKCDADPILRKKSNAILKDYREELQIVTIRCNERLHEQMAAETKKFYKRHPELKN